MAVKNHHSLLFVKLRNHHTCSCEFLELKTLLLTCERLSWIMFHVSSSQFLEISFAASKLTWAVNLLYKRCFAEDWYVGHMVTNEPSLERRRIWQTKTKRNSRTTSEWNFAVGLWLCVRFWLWESLWAQPLTYKILFKFTSKNNLFIPKGVIKKEQRASHET